MPNPPKAFDDFGLDPRLTGAVQSLGFDIPTPIQVSAIPALLSGRDVVGKARTGSGKTAAFGLPMLERLKEGGRAVRALVLAPTRELAVQVTEALRSYASELPVRVVTLYGGVAYAPQLAALSRGVSVVVGTPGRVLDHLDRKTLDLSSIEVLVLDEADEMLRMGFIDDVLRVLAATPPNRQVVLFSATMPSVIRDIARRYAKDPIEIEVEERSLSTDHITQRFMQVPQMNKAEALARLLALEPKGRTLVFSRTRAGAAEVATTLAERGVSVDALHGDLNQGARELVLTRFRAGRLDVVVATDVAARGLDVDQLRHVVNLDLPTDLESYVHRIGRTGRAGKAGVSTSLVTPREMGRIRAFERALGTRIVKIDAPSDAQIIERQRSLLAEEVAAEVVPEPPAALTRLTQQLLSDKPPEAILSAALALIAKERGVDFDTKPDTRPPYWANARAFEPPRSRVPDMSRSRGPDPSRSRGPDTSRSRGPDMSRPRGPDPARGRPPDDRRGPEMSRPQPDASRPRPGKRPEPRGPAPRDARPPQGDEMELFLPMGSERGLRPQDVVGALANDLGIPGRLIGRIDIGERDSFVRVPAEVGAALLEDGSLLALRGKKVRLAEARPRGPQDAPSRPNNPSFERRDRPLKRGPKKPPPAKRRPEN